MHTDEKIREKISLVINSLLLEKKTKCLMYKVDHKKWHVFPIDAQLKNIAAELERAVSAGLSGNKEWVSGAYERAISLIDASLTDPKQKDKTSLYQLRDAIAALYAGETNPAIANLISKQILLK